jgi:hypothetical protein
VVHKVDATVGDGRMESVGAVQRKVVSAVACPVILGDEEPFVDTAKYFRADDLPV